MHAEAFFDAGLEVGEGLGFTVDDWAGHFACIEGIVELGS
jgi:hypothetical protein